MQARLSYEPVLKPLSGQELQQKVDELQRILDFIRYRLTEHRRATDTELIQDDDPIAATRFRAK